MKLFPRLICIACILFHAAIVRIEAESGNSKPSKKRVAIIGGGISGTFAAKYLADYDENCEIGSITLFDPFFQSREKEEELNSNPSHSQNIYPKDLKTAAVDKSQGSRVSSTTLSDGTVVELGASIVYDGNRLVREMMAGDSEYLQMGEPFHPGSKKQEWENKYGKFQRNGFGIYSVPLHDLNITTTTDADDFQARFEFSTANMTKSETIKALLWRYNLDIWRVNRVTDQVITRFNRIYDLLDSMDESTFYTSPDDLLDDVSLLKVARVSFEDLLDHIHVAKDITWWRSKFLLGDQGVFRDELLECSNICNNNQNNAQMTGLAGLINFEASRGKLFSVIGGNYRLVQSAFQQASTSRIKSCSNVHSVDTDKVKIQFVKSKISTVLSESGSVMELFSKNTCHQNSNKDNCESTSSLSSEGEYDVVILATPLQFSEISFLVKGSLFDDSILYDMPLNGMVDGDELDANAHGHGAAIQTIPESASRPYIQVVTTVISGGSLNLSYLHMGEKLMEDSSIPTSILFTKKGQKSLKGHVSAISKLTSDGIYKVFSSEELSMETIREMFGPNSIVEKVKVWGGKHGGATPSFEGGGEASAASKFLLYDGTLDTKGKKDGASLYYTNAIESYASAIEVVALGSKAVAKLVANRLGLIQHTKVDLADEL